jgi:TRAP-type C4-dicarboxylate transport system permease small subunit
MGGSVSPLKKILKLNRFLLAGMILSMGSCLLMVALTVMDVFGRYVLGKPLPGVIEFNEVLMVCVVFLGLGLSQKEKAQIRAELLISRLSPMWRKKFDLIALFLSAAFWLVLLVPSSSKAWSSFLIGEYREGLLKFPIWPARWALVLGILLMWLQLLRDIGRHFRSEKEPS